MLSIAFEQYAHYSANMLYQWDLNQILTVSGADYETAPIVNFCNKLSKEAISKQSELKDGVITCEIPNELLRDPYDIIAYFYSVKGKSGNTVDVVRIPVISRVKPDNYDFMLDKSETNLDDVLIDRVLAWHDEFEGSELNRDIWDFELGYIRNNEIQYYTDDYKNVSVFDSILTLTALKNNPVSGYQWSSASIISSKKYAFYRGLIEAKIKTEPNKGVWPAFWAKGDSYYKIFPSEGSLGESWPQCAEVDVCELVGDSPHMRPGIFWYNEFEEKQYSKSADSMPSTSGVKIDDNWHIYGWEKTATHYNFYLDRELVGSIEISNIKYAEELERAMYIQFNIAVGGGAVGNPDATLGKSCFYVDWVRAYLPAEADEIIEPNFRLDCGPAFSLNANKIRYLRPLWDSDYGTNYALTWESSDPNVATVYGGKVITYKNGTCKITAESKTGKSYSTDLTVSDEAVNYIDTLIIKGSSDFLEYLDNMKLSAYISPGYATNTNVTWSCSNENIATVDSNGNVTAVNPEGGNIVITCTSADGNVSASYALECKSDYVADTIDTDGILYKYTKKGWSTSNTWTDDTDNGSIIDFTASTDSSYKITYVPGYGYHGDRSPSVKYSNDLPIGTIDITEDFTIISRIYIPDLTDIQNNGTLFSILKSAYFCTSAATTWKTSLANDFSTVNSLCRSNSTYGDTTTKNVENRITLDDNILNYACVFNAAAYTVTIYCNNQAPVTVDVSEVLSSINTTGYYTYVLVLGVYGQVLQKGYYQGLLAYSNAKTATEISNIFSAMNTMYG